MSRGLIFSAPQDLVTETCCRCNILFAFPKDLQDRAKANRGPDGVTFCCPLGHKQWYVGETEADKLRRENQRLTQNAAYLDERLTAAQADAEHQRHRANGYKGHATRITKRAKAGVCPCCNRTFKQLAAHMASQHPGFTPIEEETAHAQQ